MSSDLLQLLARDPVFVGKFEISKFMCASCRQLVSVATHFIQLNNQSNSGLQEFFAQQHYFEDFKSACKHEFLASGANAGQFFACEIVLGLNLNAIQKRIVEVGVELASIENKLCFEQGLRFCS
ncbi:hypothetical protein M3Y96_00616200 [Aphelenchoides besseyi]|nr:hypothetical protein M3Y96_00616200 [Aphelenchoides besseyi]